MNKETSDRFDRLETKVDALSKFVYIGIGLLMALEIFIKLIPPIS